MLTLIGVRMHHEDPSIGTAVHMTYLIVCIMENAKWTCRYMTVACMHIYSYKVTEDSCIRDNLYVLYTWPSQQ